MPGVAALTGKARDRRIADLETELAVLKRARKADMLRERARRQHADPAFIAALQAGREKFWADPVRSENHRAKSSARMRERAARTAPLPVMNDEQRRLYRRLRHKGCCRISALAEVFRSSRSADPQSGG